MRIIFAPFTWFGRVLLWVFLFPIGVWRSMRHHRKKAERRAVARMRKEMAREAD